MTSNDFEINDLVWAKMKGYPYWPGKITSPDEKTKPKKNHHYVYFFGSNNYAWIADDLIELHSEEMIEKYGQRKGELFRKAVETITKEGKTAPKKCTSAGKVESQGEETSDKVANSESQSKNNLDNNSPQKIKKKLALTISPINTHSKVIRVIKKRTDLPFQNKHKHYTISGVQSNRCGLTGLKRKRYIPLPDIPVIDLTHKSETLEQKTIAPTEKTIGFLGLNSIGQGIIKNLHHSRHSLVIWSKTEKECQVFAENFEEIIIATTPAEVMKTADLVFSCMTDSEAAKKVIEGRNGILEGLEQSREDKSYIEMTPIDPKMSEMIETDIKGKGGRYLEAPFTGSRIEADEGTLLIVAAGDKTVYDDCRSCFDAMSKKHIFISAEVGSAAKLNVIHNMMIGTAYAAFAECLAVAYKCNLKGEDLCEILNVGSWCNNSMLHMLTSMVKKNDIANIPLKQMQQNFRIGLSLAHELSQRTKVFSSCNEMFKRCKMMKYGDHDVSAVFEGTKSFF